MRETCLDLQALRSFVLGIEYGSFALAAKHLHKSTSAVSAHLKKLEQQTQCQLVKKEGRHLQVTPQGELLLSYARQMLSLNNQVLRLLNAKDIEGKLSVGLQEDFASSVFTDCLGRFSSAHHQLQLNTAVSRYASLIQNIEDAKMDLCFTWQGHNDTPYSQTLGQTQIQWLAAKNFPLEHIIASGDPIPLAMVEPHCLFRAKAIEALDAHGIKWTLVYQSQSLSGIWPAVNAGIGITARTSLGCPRSIRAETTLLPDLGDISIQVHKQNAQSSDLERSLIHFITDELKSHLKPSRSVCDGF